jgi:hypothetical protein
MLIIHSVVKLLNTSRLKPVLYISKQDEGQQLHSWYARLLPTGFSGKLLVMYVHEPSLMTIICKGKTIQGTWSQFVNRLESLLRKFNFSEEFVVSELKLMTNYVVSKTQSKSMLGYMNQIAFQLSASCDRYPIYEGIPLDLMEAAMMNYLYQDGPKASKFQTALNYWRAKEKLI